MAEPPPRLYHDDMPTSSKVAALVLAAFGAFSVWVIAGHGYFGFLSLAGREPWGLQMLLDVMIACAIGIAWMIGDARKHAIKTWPYVVTTLVLGSIGLLAYVVRRGLGAR
jgi:hypothetical protein